MKCQLRYCPCEPRERREFIVRNYNIVRETNEIEFRTNDAKIVTCVIIFNTSWILKEQIARFIIHEELLTHTLVSVSQIKIR